MSGEWTLPYIQERLDALRPGQDFSLSREDTIRLFGLNDAAVGRIGRFAEGHRCFPIYFAGGVMFRKNFRPVKAPARGRIDVKASKAEQREGT